MAFKTKTSTTTTTSRSRMGGLGGKQEPGRWDPRIFGRRRPLPLMLAASVQKSDDVEAQRIEIGQMAQEDRPI